MTTRIPLSSSILFLAALAGGCVQSVGEEPNAAAVHLSFSYELDDTSLRGTLGTGATALRFAVLQKNETLRDVSVELNGLVVSAIVSQTEQTMDFDGFTAGSGAATQMRDEDRSLLHELHEALGADETLRAHALGVLLEHGVSVWSQMSDGFPLTKTYHADTDRSYASLCDLCGQFAEATHDCNVCERWDPACTSSAQLGTREGSTQYFVNGSWSGTGVNHQPNVLERGSCFGNCGDGCPDWGDQQLTEDCLDHDQCIRNGHSGWLGAPGWCDDELAAAVDDEFAAPVCSRLVADTTTVPCRATKNSKGWYVISSCNPCPSGTSPSGYTNAGHPTWYPSLKCSAPAHWICP